MKLAVFFQYPHPESYVIDAPKDDLDAILSALDALDAPIYCGNKWDLEEAIQEYIEESDGESTREDAMEMFGDMGYVMVNDMIVDLNSFRIEPMPPNTEVGVYRHEDYRFRQYNKMKTNRVVRVR